MNYRAFEDERQRQPEEFSGDRPSMRSVPASERRIETQLEGPTRLFTFNSPGLVVDLTKRHGGIHMASPMVKFAGFGATEPAARRDFAGRFEADYDAAKRVGGEAWARFDTAVASVQCSAAGPPVEEFWESSVARKCIADIARLSNAGDDEAALDVAYDTVDRLLTERKFQECDDLLDLVDVDSMALAVSLGLCSITSPARRELRRRANYVQRLRERLRRTDAERVERLLAGIG